jgi:dTMP kinase
MFITFEGVDGSGKTTQAALLAEALRAEGHDVVATREPGGTELGERIRELLLDGGVITPWAEASLFAAARAQLVDEVIRPALARGADVISDRYIDSSLAYQGLARGLGVDRVHTLLGGPADFRQDGVAREAAGPESASDDGTAVAVRSIRPYVPAVHTGTKPETVPSLLPVPMKLEAWTRRPSTQDLPAVAVELDVVVAGSGDRFPAKQGRLRDDRSRRRPRRRRLSRGDGSRQTEDRRDHEQWSQKLAAHDHARTFSYTKVQPAASKEKRHLRPGAGHGHALPTNALGFVSFRPSMFITFEGVDGSGKTTQAALLAEALRAEGHDVVATREPGGTELGERIRELLLDGGVITPWAEASLFAAARAQLVDEVIRPALARGADVISDRYIDSSLAYQGLARGLGVDRVLELNLLATGGLLPDRTFLLLLAPEQAARRRRGAEADRIEGEGNDFAARVDDAYRELAAVFGQRLVTIDASLPVEAIARTIRGQLRDAA